MINDPGQTWTYLNDQEVKESKPEYMQNNYYLPMMAVVAVLIFLMKGWGTPFDMEDAMKAAVSFLAAYFLGLFLANFLVQQTFVKLLGFPFDKDKLQVFVGYCMSFLMLVELFSATFPHIKFLSFTAFYLFYIIWCATDTYFGLAEKLRWRFTLLTFFEIWLSPLILGGVMSMMTR